MTTLYLSFPPGCLGNEGLAFNGSIGHRNTDHFALARPEEGGGSSTASQRKVLERREAPPEGGRTGGGQHRRYGQGHTLEVQTIEILAKMSY